MLSWSFVISKNIAWYNFMILRHQKVYCLVCFHDPPSSEWIHSWTLTLYLSYGCLRMCFYTSWQNFANVMSPAQMSMPSRTASKFCARARTECPEICVPRIDIFAYLWNHCCANCDSTLRLLCLVWAQDVHISNISPSHQTISMASNATSRLCWPVRASRGLCTTNCRQYC